MKRLRRWKKPQEERPLEVTVQDLEDRRRRLLSDLNAGTVADEEFEYVHTALDMIDVSLRLLTRKGKE